jgi:hypothetical protein
MIGAGIVAARMEMACAVTKIGRLRGGDRAIARPACRHAPTKIASAVVGSVIVSAALSHQGWSICAAKELLARHDLSSNMARPFIDHSSGMWNFRCDRLLIRCLCSMRKVKP